MHDRRAGPALAGLAAATLLALAGCWDDDVPPAPPAEDEGFQLQPFLTGFAQPVFLTHAGDGSGRLFIVEQAGVVKLWDGNTATTYLDLRPASTAAPEAFEVRSGGERGLLGLAFHPGFEENGRLFVHFTAQSGDVTVAEFHADPEGAAADPSSGRVLLSEEHRSFSNHNGGMLAFGPDGYLYAGLGDGGSGGDPNNHAQSLDTLLGKVVRIDVDGPVGTIPYLIPEDNPFASRTRGAEIWAYGLRNPWRFSFDRETGDLWIADVGQQRYEEVNLEPAGFEGGANYGWSRFEGRHVYDSDRSAPGAVAPVAEYDHDGGHCSVTGGYVYRGDAVPGLEGAYVFADYCSGVVWTLREAGGAWDMRRVLDTPHNVSSFGEDEDGELYVVDHGGDVLKVVPA